jgi:hypothetical protein
MFSLMLPVLVFGNVLTYTIQNNGVNYDRESNQITLTADSGFDYTTAPGSYRLPAKAVSIILPPDAENISASYTINGRKSKTAVTPDLNNPFTDGEHILTSKPALQPKDHVVYQGKGKWGDVLFARFAIFPMLYNTNSKTLEIASEITLQVSYTTSKLPHSNNIPPMLKNGSSFINPEVLGQWYITPNHRTYDYLIVTTPALYAAAGSLVTLHQGQGMITAFAEIDSILSNTFGSSPAEKLRNYLISEYADSPFSYLLLIGDIDLIPIAYLTPEPNGVDTVPSDFYYSDLSSDFDSDNDGKLGEYNTGMDYTPELAVGRIPWNDALTVSQISARIANFESGDFLWKHKTLLPAAILNYADEVQNVGFERTDGATFMEYCKTNVLSSYYNTTLYEQLGELPSYPSDYPLTADSLAYLLNTQSYGIVNWSAHGSPSYSARKVWTDDQNANNIPEPNELQWFSLVESQTFNNLSNQDGSVFFCSSCLNGMIDNTEPSLGEILIQKKAVADIAATRTGWYKIGWANPGWGGVTSYNYHWLENYAQLGMTVGQAHGYTNWMHTQYCLFGDPIDSNGIIWPELQNIYTYLLFGDPAIGYPAQTTAPTGQILIWEPVGNTGNAIVNGLHSLAPFNVVYTDHLIDTYNYLNQFDAIFCLFGLGYGENVYNLTPGSFEYNYLLAYLQQGGKVYMEGMVSWDSADSLFGRFGTIAPFDHVAFIEHLRYGTDPQSQIWDYSGYNQGTQALLNTGTTAQPLFHSYNVEHVNDIIGVWNQVGESRTISSSFNLAGVYSDLYSYSDFLGIILDTLDVYRPIPVSNQDDTAVPNPLSVTVAPNPFGNNLSITAKSYTKVRLGIYNIKGQLIQTAVVVPANGKIQWNWNNKDTNNRQLPSGIYLLRLDNGLRKTVIKTLKLN